MKIHGSSLKINSKLQVLLRKVVNYTIYKHKKYNMNLELLKEALV